ncbi:MAG: hypothetical protein KF742_01745 [Cryobacterium sp.]|nr:hypothetical protein [Cryobacterium sp.]
MSSAITGPRRERLRLDVELGSPPTYQLSEDELARRRERVGRLYVQNVVMTCVAGPFDLDAVAQILLGRKNDRFARSVYITPKEPRCTLEVFPNKILALGLPSEEAGQLAITALLAMLSVHFGRPFAYRNLLVYNILATMHMNAEVDAAAFYRSLLRGVYNPESIGAVFTALQVPRGDVPQVHKKTNKRVSVVGAPRRTSRLLNQAQDSEAVLGGVPPPGEELLVHATGSSSSSSSSPPDDEGGIRLPSLPFEPSGAARVDADEARPQRKRKAKRAVCADDGKEDPDSLSGHRRAKRPRGKRARDSDETDDSDPEWRPDSGTGSESSAADDDDDDSSAGAATPRIKQRLLEASQSTALADDQVLKCGTVLVYERGGVVAAGFEDEKQLLHAERRIVNALLPFARGPATAPRR